MNDMQQWNAFWSKVDRSGECWIWTGDKMPRGYGRVRRRDRTYVGAHRVAWEIVKGPIPAGLHVCHRCDNPPCVRPDHLFVGTASDNARDRDAKGRNSYAAKTHCPRGHEYSPGNTYRRPHSGHRGCRTCMRAKAKLVNEKRKLQRRNLRAPARCCQPSRVSLPGDER